MWCFHDPPSHYYKGLVPKLAHTYIYIGWCKQEPITRVMGSWCKQSNLVIENDVMANRCHYQLDMTVAMLRCITPSVEGEKARFDL